MRIGCVLVILANIIYHLDGWKITDLSVEAYQGILSIGFPKPKFDGIDMIYLQATRVSYECEVKYAYLALPDYQLFTPRATFKFEWYIRKGDKVRVQILAEGKKSIETQNGVFTINSEGSIDIDEIPTATCKSAPARKQTPTESPPLTCDKLIFEDNFNDDQILTEKWDHQVIYRNLEPYKEFVAFVSDPINSNITNNKLHIYMTDGISPGKMPLGGGCKGTNLECGSSKNKSHFKPITKRSANLYSKFTFKYGRIEISAQMPRGDWLFPNILLEPKIKLQDKPKDQIRLYSRGNDFLQDKNLLHFDGRSLFGSVVVWHEEHNVWKPSEYWTVREGKRKDSHFWRDPHNYTIIWQKNKISFKVNGVHFGDITNRNLLERFNEHECHLVLGLTAGGKLNFDDEVLMAKHKSFVNTNPSAEKIFIEEYDKAKATPLIVDNIRVYELNEC